jgi:hypothetical protein
MTDPERSLGRKISAPWTDDQIASLNAYQKSGVFHEYTCRNDGCPAFLMATPAGWVCAVSCSYTQNWAYALMTDWSWQLL